MMLQRYKFNRSIFEGKLKFIQVAKIIGDPRLWKEKAGCFLPMTNWYTYVYDNVCLRLESFFDSSGNVTPDPYT